MYCNMNTFPGKSVSDFLSEIASLFNPKQIPFCFISGKKLSISLMLRHEVTTLKAYYVRFM